MSRRLRAVCHWPACLQAWASCGNWKTSQGPGIIQGQETYMATLKIRASRFACVSDIRLKIESASCH